MAVRKAGDDRGIQALGLAALAASQAPGVVSAIDLISGDTHALNSGELPLNALITLLPALSTTAGVGAAVAASPVARASLDLTLAEQAQRGLLRRAEALAARERAGQSVDPRVLEALLKEQISVQGRVQEAMGSMRDQAARLRERNLQFSEMDALRTVGRRGMRQLYGGALAGALAGGIPAILAMQDQPAVAA